MSNYQGEVYSDANTLSTIMTTEEVCRRFHIVAKTLYKWRKQYNFPAPQKHGNKNFFDRNKVLEWEHLTQGGFHFHNVKNGYSSEFIAALSQEKKHG